MKLVPFIGTCNRIWYLERSAWKNVCITLSVLSLIMISMSSLFECLTSSSSVSLWETKWIAIVSRIFHVSDFLDHLWYFLGMV